MISSKKKKKKNPRCSDQTNQKGEKKKIQIEMVVVTN